MSSMYGWTGKILKVDLTKGTLSTVDTSKYVPKYVGGLGMGHAIAWEEIPKGTKAFDPENRLIITVGPLTGTSAPCSGRAEVSGISPHSIPEQYTNSGIGGWFPSRLKWAGYDGIIIQGKASVPSYILIGDEDPQIKPCDGLWGLGATDAQVELRRRHGGDNTDSYCIGPAGENLCRISTIQHGTHHGTGQGGFGAVAGSKNLKAICINGGTNQVKIANPDELLRIVSEIQPKKTLSPIFSCDLKDSPYKDTWIGDYSRMALGDITSGPFKWRRTSCCTGCLGACAFYEFKDVPAATRPGMLTGVIGCVAVRYEQQFHENPRPNFSAGFEANMLAGQMGLNHHELSYGIVPWLYRTKQMGIDTEKLLGMPIDVRSPEWWVKLINMIAYRKGFGDLLAEGTARTVERLGKAKYADPIYKGQDSIFDDLTQKIPVAALGGWGYLSRELLIELPHPIYIPGALNWMIDTRDPHHSKWPDVASPKFLEFVTSPDPYVSPLGPQLAYSSTIRGNLIDSLTTCWEFPMRQGLGWEYPFEVGTHTKWTDTESRLFSAVTGIKTTEEELDEAAKRITTLFRAIQIRNHDRTAQMEWNEFMPLLRKVDIDEDKFATTVGNFYDLWGWDRKTGWPTRATLESLDLKDVADELQTLGKLP